MEKDCPYDHGKVMIKAPIPPTNQQSHMNMDHQNQRNNNSMELSLPNQGMIQQQQQQLNSLIEIKQNFNQQQQQQQIPGLAGQPQPNLIAQSSMFNRQQLLQSHVSVNHNLVSIPINYNMPPSVVHANINSQTNQTESGFRTTTQSATPKQAFQPLRKQQQHASTNVIRDTTLVAKEIPFDLNRIDELRQYFARFGQNIKIQCQYENCPDAALIRFDTNSQAYDAYKYSKSVNTCFNLFWFSYYQKQQQKKQVRYLFLYIFGYI